MPEPFEYAKTITIILRKLKKQFPTEISFSVDTEGWIRDWEEELKEPIQYKIWDTKTNKFSISTLSLEHSYQLKLEQLKNV